MNQLQAPTTQKITLVTGATNGIGKVTALELARLGYRVLMTSRDPVKGQKVLEEIRAQTSNNALELYVGDLSKMDDVGRIALEVSAQHDRLDILVNNAGGVFRERQETVDGFEYTFAFNHLAYFLLTNLLIDTLKAAGNARVISVSSSGNNLGRMRWDDLEFRAGYNGSTAYLQSKLMNVLFANALARRLQGAGVTSNSVHPGVVRSGFGKTLTGIEGFILSIAQNFSVTPERGAETSLYLATSSQVTDVTGTYFAAKKISRANPIAYNESAQDRLWALSEKAVSKWLDQKS